MLSRRTMFAAPLLCVPAVPNAPACPICQRPSNHIATVSTFHIEAFPQQQTTRIYRCNVCGSQFSDLIT